MINPNALIIPGRVNVEWYRKSIAPPSDYASDLQTSVAQATKDIGSHNELLSGYKEVLLPRDLQDILHLSRNTIYSYLAKGKIRSIRIGVKYLIPKQYLLEYLYPT
ncbi:MAG: helix-turn-helix domain-containing protein [Lachnospiraceae bacterium]|nr:helix-turn-helix domain-containing protein [Lachnospiraceae bacterium]